MEYKNIELIVFQMDGDLKAEIKTWLFYLYLTHYVQREQLFHTQKISLAWVVKFF